MEMGNAVNVIEYFLALLATIILLFLLIDAVMKKRYVFVEKDLNVINVSMEFIVVLILM